MIHVHLTAAERIVAASTAVGTAVGAIAAPSLDWNALLGALIGGVVTSVVSGLVVGLSMVYVNRTLTRRDRVFDQKLTDIHSKVDGLTSQLVTKSEEATAHATELGEVKTAAATELGAAREATAYAKGHGEGVVHEQQLKAKEEAQMVAAQAGVAPEPNLKK